MSKNDSILLGQLLEQQHASEGQGLNADEYFEVFAAKQVLKDEDLSYDELRDGIIDGAGDGGMDGIYLFINDALCHEDTDFGTIARNPEIRLVILQSKTSHGFSETAINKLRSSAEDLFDLGRELDDVANVYNAGVLAKMKTFRKALLTLLTKAPTLKVAYHYVTNGVEVHPNVSRKKEALQAAVTKLFNPASADLTFWTASDLLKRSRDSPASPSTLKLAEGAITSDDGYICLVNLKDYFAFIADDHRRLRSHIFEGNVRDYQNQTEVNQGIRSSVVTPGAEDFWWLNNGVSILCSGFNLAGKTLTIHDAEVVNGLQTSHEIYEAWKDSANEPSEDGRNILVRVMKPSTRESRDRIIKATNSQTPISAASLRATEKIHRDIEDFLLGKGFFYDRRKNYYRNQGKPIGKILSIPYVAQAALACALMDPSNARARPSSLLKSDAEYRKIFDPAYPFDIYYKCPLLVREVEAYLKRSGSKEYAANSANLKYYVAMVWVLGQFSVPIPKPALVATIDLNKATNESLSAVAAEVWVAYVALGATDQVAKGTELVKALLKAHSDRLAEARDAKRTVSGSKAPLKSRRPQ